MDFDRSIFEKVDILIVDDLPENLLALEAVLNSPEYNLIQVNSGDQALRYLLSHNPALILMDVQMPELSGFETASIIKGNERTREIPIIFITAAMSDERFAHKGYEYGAVDYIYKPYDAYILKSKVAVFVEIKKQKERISRLVSVQKAATRALAESSTVNEAITKVLKSICVSLGWDLGIFWKVDKQDYVLRSCVEWHYPEHSISISEIFRKTISRGVCLPGKVWANQQAFWISDIRTEKNSCRFEVAWREGLKTAVGLKIGVLNETLGVLEFYSRNQQPEDFDLIKIMGAIGSQIGQTLKKTEAIEQVKASEFRKAAILETALDCILSIDQTGKIIEANPAAERVFGYKQSEILEKNLNELVVPSGPQDSSPVELKHSTELMNRRIEVLGYRVSGSGFPAEMSITPVSNLQPFHFTVFIRDISRRKRNERNTAFLMEASTALSASLNYEENLITLANLTAKMLGGGCAIDVIDEGFLPRSVAIAHSDPVQKEKIQRLRERYTPIWNSNPELSNSIHSGKSVLHSDVQDEFIAKCAKDQEHLELLSELSLKSVIFIPLIARSRTLGVITLVSSQNRIYLEEDLVVAEEMSRRAAIAIDNSKLYLDAQEAIQVRDEFFSIASHELKTPLTSLKLMLQMTQRRVKPAEGIAPPPEKLAELLVTSVKQVDRLGALVEDLLDVVKIRAGKLSFDLKEFDLSLLLKEVLDRHMDALCLVKCPVELQIEPEIFGVWDPNRIEQIIVNLISNVIKYAPGKPVKFQLQQNNKTAKLIVQDFGPGISEKQQLKIFERFERAMSSRNISGLGLGLFIVKQIVEAHRGTIYVESQLGFGSTFTIELPTQPAGTLINLPKKGDGIRWKQTSSL